MDVAVLLNIPLMETLQQRIRIIFVHLFKYKHSIFCLHLHPIFNTKKHTLGSWHHRDAYSTEWQSAWNVFGRLVFDKS